MVPQTQMRCSCVGEGRGLGWLAQQQQDGWGMCTLLLYISEQCLRRQSCTLSAQAELSERQPRDE